MKKIEVKWRDITYEAGWREMHEIEKFLTEDDTVVQVGYLFKETDSDLIILDSYFTDMKILGGIHKIPKGCILSIKELADK